MLAPAIEPEGMVGDGAEHADPSASTADISVNNGRKNRSKERDYFHITPAVNGQPGRAKCIDCGTQVIFSHGTSVCASIVTVLVARKNVQLLKRCRTVQGTAYTSSSGLHHFSNIELYRHARFDVSNGQKQGTQYKMHRSFYMTVSLVFERNDRFI